MAMRWLTASGPAVADEIVGEVVVGLWALDEASGALEAVFEPLTHADPEN